jgi:hypothetical protein
MHEHPWTWLALLLPVPQAFAQTITPLVRVGDAIPGAGTAQDFRGLQASSLAYWRAIVDTDDPLVDSAVMAGGQVTKKVGDTLPILGFTIAAIEHVTVDLIGSPGMLLEVSGAGTPKAIVTGSQAQIQVGAGLPLGTDFPAGVVVVRLDDARFTPLSSVLLVRGAFDDPQSGNVERDFVGVAYEGGSPGHLSYLRKIALEDELAPGLSRQIERLRMDLPAAGIDPAGGFLLWTCDLAGSTSDDMCVYRSAAGYPGAPHTLVAREGAPTPVPGRNWGDLEDLSVSAGTVYASATAHWSLRARLDPSDPSTDEVLVVDGELFAREGFPGPGTGPWPIESLGSGAAYVDDFGRVLWYARWDDPTTPGVDEALFLDDVALVRTGLTQVGGATLVDLETGPDSFALSPSFGKFLLFVGSLSDGTRALFHLGQSLDPANYCTAKTSSAGCLPELTGTLAVPPSASLGQGFHLRAKLLEPKMIGVFLYSVVGSAALPWLGGTLCIASPFRRVGMSGTGGTLGQGCSGAIQMDFNAWIASGADPALAPGQRVFAQAWFRDPGFAPPENIGLTDGLSFVIGP